MSEEQPGDLGAADAARRPAAKPLIDGQMLFAASPAPMLIIAVDAPHFTIIGVNDAYLAATMRTRDGLVGSALFQAMPDNPADGSATGVINLRSSIERAIASKLPDLMLVQKYDIPHPAGDFEERWWTPINAPVLDVDGQVIAVVHHVTDATDRVRAEQALQRLNSSLETEVGDRTAELSRAEEQLRQSQKLEAIGQLTGGVAHDFNNLLTVIKGSVELLQRPTITDERRKIYVSAIEDATDRAASLTAQLLAFARRQALTPKIFDAGESLTEVASIIRTLAGSRIDLEVITPKQAISVLADRNQLDTAIVNMALNARDAMGGAGKLTIAVGAVSGIPPLRSHPAIAGDFVAVTIADNGTGIAPDKLARIFEPFFTTKGVGQGTGLGLSQVIGFAKQSGGDIRVESDLGRGTTFTLYLPRAYPDEVTQETLEPEHTVNGKGVCVLVVEDNPTVGKFATEALAELGYESLLAPDAQHALDMLAKDSSRFDIVFSDVVMPGMDGMELGAEIQKLYPNLPVILTSGYSHILSQNGQHGFELLHKPYSVEQLSRVLQKAIAWQQAARRSQ